MKSMLWAYDARHFVACNGGVTSFLMFYLVHSSVEHESDSKRTNDLILSNNGTGFGLVLRVVTSLCLCFILHFVAHLPFDEIVPSLLVNSGEGNSASLSKFTSIGYSDYLIDHTIACVMGFLTTP